MRKRRGVNATAVVWSAQKKLRGLSLAVVQRPIADLKPFPNNPRQHPQKQINALAKSIRAVGFINPVTLDEHGMILLGHGRVEAARLAGLTEVPTLTLTGLSPMEKRTVVIADNRLGELSSWNTDLLRGHLIEILSECVDIEATAFTTGEVDLIIDGKSSSDSAPDPDDVFDDLASGQPPVAIAGDQWLLARHRLLCANALAEESYGHLLGGERAQMVVTDPPYNVRVQGHVMGRGRIHHREFPMASGEMSHSEYFNFLKQMAFRLAQFSEDGSIHYIFMDWRHIAALIAAAGETYSEHKNLLVWNKTNGGQGSFYRSQHELIGVFKNGDAPHINNFELGGNGRYRTNVIDYPGVNGFHPSRRGDLQMHPTVKPIGLIADLIRDCSKRDGLILDAFGGSGTMLLAAERTGRRAAMIELDPAYVDVAIRRFERMTGITAVHAGTGASFEQVGAQRHADPEKSVLSHSVPTKPGKRRGAS